jgi:large subunit ribosomal protein L25
MEIANIKGETRRREGRHANDQLRRRGMVPGVIYGHGRGPELVALSRHDTELALRHMQHVISLQIDGAGQQYLIKDVQYDHLQKTPIHVDLMRVDPNERVHVKVSLELKGTPKGCLHGGNLVHVMADLDVECLLLNIPESIRARVDHLGLTEALHVKDVQLPPDVRATADPDDIIAVVHPPRGKLDSDLEEEEAAAEGEGAEPEIIGKGPKEGEDEGGD